MSPPLADRLRPATLEDFVGQDHLVGNNGFISKIINNSSPSGVFPSLIFWGPPGSGKTTLARILSSETKRPFFEFSPVTSSISDIKKAIPSHSSSKQGSFLENSQFSPINTQHSPIIFIDEIHRMNKAQQDALLPHVEKGSITLIGATTENPSFEVIGPLLSRCRVVVFNQLTEEDLKKIISRALLALTLTLTPKALQFLLQSANGDARVALNVLDIASQINAGVDKLDIPHLEQALQKRQLGFDREGEEYYNTISALHKSIRGSDPDAALYYLARMLEAGQDPLYIARRLIRASAEDIGLADPQALVIANAAFEACDKIGMPECNVILAEAVIYLAKAPKSNALYTGYNQASADVHMHGNLPVPMHIRNAPTKLMKDIGYGKGYDYSHSQEGKKKEGIVYLPDKLKNKKYIP